MDEKCVILISNYNKGGKLHEAKSIVTAYKMEE